jgi:dihydroorotate dehydrogenase (NAD+) catalytic subunit
MNAAGTLGFAAETGAPIAWANLGAFVTNPISMRPRNGAAKPALIEYHGGFLIHTGLPNGGFRKVLQKHGNAWKHSRLPVIVHLMADRPEEAREMVQTLEGVDNILAAELGFAPLLADDIILMAVEMCQGELPLIVSLEEQQLLRIGGTVLSAGAVAVSIASPRGMLESEGEFISGRLTGPSLFPASLKVVSDSARIGLPIIGAGGISSLQNAKVMLEAGALAVQLDARALWLPESNKKSLVV